MKDVFHDMCLEAGRSSDSRDISGLKYQIDREWNLNGRYGLWKY